MQTPSLHVKHLSARWTAADIGDVPAHVGCGKALSLSRYVYDNRHHGPMVLGRMASTGPYVPACEYIYHLYCDSYLEEGDHIWMPSVPVADHRR